MKADLDWLEKRFRYFAQFYDQETATCEEHHVETQADIVKAERIIRDAKRAIRSRA